MLPYGAFVIGVVGAHVYYFSSKVRLRILPIMLESNQQCNRAEEMGCLTILGNLSLSMRFLNFGMTLKRIQREPFEFKEIKIPFESKISLPH